VPDRGPTAAENDRLLATLVAEGTPNRQLATVLQVSEKSVEGRLSRLLRRTGYRSRVEIATAVFNATFGS
jgi:DNA-binding NarL/FixJ family response regulator